MNVFTNGFLNINGSAFLPVQSISFDPRVEKFAAGTAGAVDISHKSTQRTIPVCRVTTHAVAAGLGVVGFAGLAITTVADIFFQSVVSPATHGGTTTNRKLTINEGLLVPRSIRAGKDSLAEYEFEIFAVFDGTNNPAVSAIDQSMPSGSQILTEAFVAGTCVIPGIGAAAADVDVEVQEMNLDFGIQEFTAGINGEAFARHASIMAREVELELTTLDLEACHYAGNVGQAVDDILVYLRKVDNKALRVADATAEHIEIAFAESHVSSGSEESSQGSEATGRILVSPIWDGTNAVAVIDTTAAYNGAT